MEKVSSADHQSARNSWRCRLIVEPLTVVFMLAYGMLIMLRVEYLNKRLSQEANFTNPTTNTSVACALNSSSEEYDRYIEVQTQTSYWTLYIAVAQALPAFFSANLIGALSDAKGRRVAMLFPITGFAVYSIFYALVAQLHLPLWVLIIGTLPLGLCGDFVTLVACSFAYIADTTTSTTRTYRMVILECLTSVGAGAGQVGVGFMVQVTGFPPVYYTILGLMIMCAIYVFFLPESLPKAAPKLSDPTRPEAERSSKGGFGLMKFIGGIADLFRSDANGRCWKMVSYNVILFQFVLIIVSFLSTNVLVAEGQPFCWSSALIGIFNGLTFLFSSFGLVIGGYVLRLCFSDHFIMQISILSFVSALVLAAFSYNNVMLYAVTVMGTLRMLAMPICRAKMSKLIGPGEQGVLFAASGCIQSLGTLLSPLIFNALYPLTLQVSGGFIFVTMAITFLLPFVLTLALQIDDRMRPTERYKSLQTEEIHGPV